MPRRPRLLYKGAAYHVMARGNRKGRVFRHDDDRLMLLERMSQARVRYDVRWLAWVLMRTHYHALAETPRGNLSEVMKFVNGSFTQDWNRRRRTTGHVFEGRFVSVLIENNRYLQNVYRYIALNPVEAGYVAAPAEWPWSSHSAIAGLSPRPEMLDLDGLARHFDGNSLHDAQRRYAEFVTASATAPDVVGSQIVVGSDDFESNVRELIGHRFCHVRVPRSYRALARPPLAELFAGCASDLDGRNHTILRAHVVHGYTQAEIARTLNLHPDTVSGIVRGIKRQRYFVVNVAPSDPIPARRGSESVT